MVMGRIREMDWECRYCGSLLGDVVSKNPPSTFSCSQIAATPILFNLVNAFIVGVIITFCVDTKFCSVWTYNDDLI